jgi:hypothetical protein
LGSPSFLLTSSYRALHQLLIAPSSLQTSCLDLNLCLPGTPHRPTLTYLFASKREEQFCYLYINMHHRCQGSNSTTMSKALRGIYLLTTTLRGICEVDQLASMIEAQPYYDFYKVYELSESCRP